MRRLLLGLVGLIFLVLFSAWLISFYESKSLQRNIQALSIQNKRIEIKLKKAQSALQSLDGKIFPMRGITITTYHAEESQTDSSPWIGAWGDLVIPGRTCAVSRDLIWGPPYLNPGDIAVVDGEPWLILDLMNERFTRRVDLLVAPWVQYKKVANVLFIKIGGENAKYGRKENKPIDDNLDGGW